MVLEEEGAVEGDVLGVLVAGVAGLFLFLFWCWVEGERVCWFAGAAAAERERRDAVLARSSSPRA